MKFASLIPERMQRRLKNLNRNLPNLNKVTKNQENIAKVRIMLKEFVQDHKLHKIVAVSVTVAAPVGSQPQTLEVEVVAVVVVIEPDAQNRRIRFHCCLSCGFIFIAIMNQIGMSLCEANQATLLKNKVNKLQLN